MNDVCFSGGSKGADYVFGEAAKAAGHTVMHFSFVGHSTPCKTDVWPLREMDLLQADKPLEAANRLLKRAFPTKSLYVNDLLRRNFFQIKETERIYAISYVDVKTGMVKGGTGWACTMGILRGVKEVYVFDQDDNAWWEFCGHEGVIFDWIRLDELPPVPHGFYTGIGSVELTPPGEEAIKNLYANSNQRE